MIEIVELPDLIAIGLVVEESSGCLDDAIAAGWTRLFETDTDATSFLRIAIGSHGDRSRILLGYLAAAQTPVPEGLVRYPIAAGRYLRLCHDGPVGTIAAGFSELRAYAAAKGHRVTDFQLDFGYIRGQLHGRHELHVLLDQPTLLLS